VASAQGIPLQAEREAQEEVELDTHRVPEVQVQQDLHDKAITAEQVALSRAEPVAEQEL
jgi:hypothetical protein